MKRLLIIENHLAAPVEICIVAAGRSPIQRSGGEFKEISYQSLAGQTITSLLKASNIESKEIQDFYMGVVLQSGLGQNPAKQVAVASGLPDSVNCFTLNKLCASAMKAISLGSLAILNRDSQCVLVGGVESMSQYPYLLALRNGINLKVKDSLEHDVLPDAVTKELATKISDHVSEFLQLSKSELDDYSKISCERAFHAQQSGKFKKEIVPIFNPIKKKIVSNDFLRTSEKITMFKPIYKNGTTSIGNTCGINDGASFLVLATREKALKENWKILGSIVSFADAEQESRKFPISPSLAVNKALKQVGMSINDIDFMEINEPFASVVLGNSRILNFPVEKINVFGGALSLGHPVGSSGCRIVVTLLNVLQENKAKYGCATICNGAGGATALLIKRE